MSFTLLQTNQQCAARRGRIATPRGEIQTPAFIPLATRGMVPHANAEELRELGAEMLVANAYHLWLRPGPDILTKHGDLHGLMAWNGPILMESGGTEIAELGMNRKVNRESIRFQSHLDGSRLELSPERSLELQVAFGGDLLTVLDEGPLPDGSGKEQERSLERRLEWIRRSQHWMRKQEREQSLWVRIPRILDSNLQQSFLAELSALNPDGFVLAESAVLSQLAKDQPRQVSGTQGVEELLELIEAGADLISASFPCDLAAKGQAITADGILDFYSETWAGDPLPLDESGAAGGQPFSRGYLQHLITQHEILGTRLLTLHNLCFVLSLMADCRCAIESDSFPEFRRAFVARYRAGQPTATTT